MWKRFKEWLNSFNNELKKDSKRFKNLLVWFLVSFILVILVEQYIMSLQPKPEEISYSEYKELLVNHKIDKIHYDPSNEYMTVYIQNEDTKIMTVEERKEYLYPLEDTKITLYPGYPEFRKDTLEYNVYLELAQKASTIEIISGLFSIAFPVLMICLLISIMKKTGAVDKETDLLQTSSVRFSDVIGLDEILDDVQFITKLITKPEMGSNIGAKVPKGILLCGEPGTGKTLIAKAIAGEAGVPFLYANASGFIEMFVGLGAKRVRNVFAVAKKHAPCVIFIDEIDAIGTKRGSMKGTSENDQTINALLQEMDGFTGREGIFIIAATNRADDLDSALTRTGRFDRIITVNPPRDWKVRQEIFKFYLDKLKIDESLDLETISRQTTGFTGSDIATICNEAGIVALMKDKEYVDMECMEEAIDKHIFKGNRTKDKEEFKNDKKIVAYHESGHAVMNYLTGQPISRASIIANTSGVGGVVFGADQDSYFTTKKQFEDKVMVCYAGRISEELKFKSITTGASNDITQATQIIKNYVERYGFDSKFGLIDMSVMHKDSLIKDDNTLDRVQDLAKQLYDNAYALLQRNYDLVETLAQELLDKETLSGKEITVLLDKKHGKTTLPTESNVEELEIVTKKQIAEQGLLSAKAIETKYNLGHGVVKKAMQEGKIKPTAKTTNGIYYYTLADADHFNELIHNNG